ncbi:DNA primase [Flagellimonas sediminis]|uniref:DNA primase n=1 Tax=Flagellimonas sediminis TaxID=2696468 RepID=UPI001943FD59|nr:DNA primase [Allomuricauda sediminis]
MNNNLRRVIVDYKKLTPEVLKLLVEKYPDGYGDNDVITFRNLKGELIEAVEVSTEDTKYLVKISLKLEHSMANYDEDEDDVDLDSEDLGKIPGNDDDFSGSDGDDVDTDDDDDRDDVDNEDDDDDVDDVADDIDEDDDEDDY